MVFFMENGWKTKTLARIASTSMWLVCYKFIQQGIAVFGENKVNARSHMTQQIVGGTRRQNHVRLTHISKVIQSFMHAFSRNV